LKNGSFTSVSALCFAQLAVSIGGFGIFFILPVYAVELGISVMMVGVILSTFSLSIVVFQYPFGRFSDRLGRRKPLVALSMVGYSVVTFLYSVVRDTVGFLVVRSVQGFVGACDQAVTPPMVADLVSSRRRGTAMGAYQTVLTVGPVVAPVLGAFVAEHLGMLWVFYLSSLLAFSSFVSIVVFVREPRRSGVKNRIGVRTRSLSELPAQARRTIIFMLFAMICTSMSIGLIMPLIRIFLYQTGSTLSELGFAFSASWITTAFFTTPFGMLSDRLRRRKPFLVLGLLGLAGVSFFLPYVTSWQILAVLLSIQGVTRAASQPASSALIADVAPSEFRGRVMGLTFTGFNVGFIIGPILGGALADLYGFATPFYLTVVVATVGAVLIALGVNEPS